MPEPISTIAIIAGLASAGIGAYAAVSSANAQAEASDYNAKVAANDAEQARQEAAYEADLIRAKNRRAIAAQRASFAAAGLQISGSVTDVLVDSATQGELDALSAEYSGKVRGSALQAESQLQKMEARNAKKSGIFGATGSALSGISQAATSYAGYRYRKGKTP